MRYLLAALGRALCPIAIDQVFVGKNRHHETWICFSDANLASAFAARE
jgi:hypothetical protein